MKFLKPLLILGLAAFAAFKLVSGGPIEHAAGVLAPDIPEQTQFDEPTQFIVGDFRLVPRARYSIKARVLSVERYSVDAGSELAPIDFAVGWGPMSDSATLEHFKIRQGGRFYSIYPDTGAIDLTLAMRSSANMHLIPADDRVRETLFAARRGSIIELEGYLVVASRPDGFTWNTSLTRDDTGNGACELMYVASAALH